jgi:uncharacterized protein DUF4062
MDKVYQVFVSSTFSDLEDERRQVSNTLAKAGYLAAGMELFPATDQQQFDFIKRVIDRSDYYVVIVGGRYGSLADGKVSYTEKEFQYARSQNIPVLAFLHKYPDRIEVGKTDQDADQATRLELFRDELRNKRMVEFWENTNDLCTKVLISVSHATNLTPRIGWIRGDQAIDPRVLQDAERTRIENVELKRRLEELDGIDLVFDSSLLGPDDSIDFKVTILITNNSGTLTVHDMQNVSAKIGELFIAIYDNLLNEPTELKLCRTIGSALSSRLNGQPNDAQYKVSKEEVAALRNQLEALNLIESIGLETAASGPFSYTMEYVAWRPTEKGRRYVIQNRAVRRRKQGSDPSNI